MKNQLIIISIIIFSLINLGLIIYQLTKKEKERFDFNDALYKAGKSWLDSVPKDAQGRIGHMTDNEAAKYLGNLSGKIVEELIKSR